MAPFAKACCIIGLVPLAAVAYDWHWKEKIGCTAIAVDGDATVDGSGFAGMNADSGEGDWRLAYIPAKHHDKGAMRSIYPQRLAYPRFVGRGRGELFHPEKYSGWNVSVPSGHIPEVESTYGYYESLQPLMNEKGVGFGESSCGAMLMNKAPGDKNDLRDVPLGLLDTAALMQLALERCATSRCAVETMGALAEEFGFGPTPGEVASTASCGGRVCWDDSGEAYTITDKSGEVWVFHIVGGVSRITKSVWAAQRVPKGHFATIANEFIIGDLPNEPNEDFLFNLKIKEAGLAAKLWDGKGVLNWKKTFAPESLTFESPAGSTPVPLYASLRQWGLLNLVAPSLKIQFKVSSQYLPFSVPVDRKLTHRDVLNSLRYNYEGTEFDLTKGVLAGPFGNPFRIEGGPRNGQIPRGIPIQRTLYSIITQSGPEKQIAWFSMDVPSTGVFVPLFSQAGAVSRVYSMGHQGEFDRASAGWAFNFVSNMMTWNYHSASQQDVYPLIKEWQDKFDQQIANLDTSNVKELAKWQAAAQEELVARWWKLADFMIMKYNDGKINDQSMGKSEGYPQDFSDMIGFSNDVHPVWVQPAATPPTSLDYVEKFPLPKIWDGARQQWLPGKPTLSMASTSEVTGIRSQALVLAMTLMVGLAMGVAIGRHFDPKRSKSSDAYYLPLS
jgi:dipeptidase